jgi:ATP-binding cassette subfamily F protein 3
MLVSHDRALLRSVCDEFWLVTHGGVEPFDGDLDDYQRYLLDEGKRVRESLKEAGKAAEASKPTPAPVAKRAAPSGKLKPLKQSLEKLDKSLAALHAEKAALEARLAGTLPVEDITQAGNQLQHVNDELEREEEKWLELSGQIEALEAESA